MGTIEKSNIFDKESVTIEHPKTIIKSSKLIKQSKIITQQPNIIKVYTKSKAADRALQLHLIKRHILLRNCLQRYK